MKTFISMVFAFLLIVPINIKAYESTSSTTDNSNDVVLRSFEPIELYSIEQMELKLEEIKKKVGLDEWLLISGIEYDDFFMENELKLGGEYMVTICKKGTYDPIEKYHFVINPPNLNILPEVDENTRYSEQQFKTQLEAYEFVANYLNVIQEQYLLERVFIDETHLGFNEFSMEHPAIKDKTTYSMSIINNVDNTVKSKITITIHEKEIIENPFSMKASEFMQKEAFKTLSDSDQKVISYIANNKQHTYTSHFVMLDVSEIDQPLKHAVNKKSSDCVQYVDIRYCIQDETGRKCIFQNLD